MTKLMSYQKYLILLNVDLPKKGSVPKRYQPERELPRGITYSIRLSYRNKVVSFEP